MSPGAQRIAIAEADGWRRYKHTVYGFDVWHHSKFGEPALADLGLSTNELPDYLNDLNAMHRAVMTLTTEQRGIYSDEIYQFAVRVSDGVTDEWFLQIEATTVQRAEAFLRAIGKRKA